MKQPTSALKWLILLLFLQINILFAQQQEVVQLKSENIFQKNGFGNVQVNAIAQDRFGFLWLGTVNGLYKYDGYSLQLFKANKDGKQLLGNYISGLFVDSKNNLWIINDEKGINKYNLYTLQLEHFVSNGRIANSLVSNQISQIIEDEFGNYWIATNDGLDKLELRKNNDGIEIPKFTHFKASTFDNENTTIPSNKITSLYVKGDVLWCGTDNGLCSIRIKTNAITQHQELNNGVEQRLAISKIAEDRAHNMWVATPSNGIWVLEKNIIGQTLFNQYIKPIPQLTGAVNTLIFDNNYNMWLGSKSGNVVKCNLMNLYVDVIDAESVGGHLVTDMYRDGTGVIWIAHENGVNKILDKKRFSNLDLKNPPFNFKDDVFIYSILEDQQGNIWLGTNTKGVIKFNPATKQITKYSAKTDKPNKLLSNEVYALNENKYMIYVGTRKGLNAIDKNSGNCIAMPEQKYPLDVNTIATDRFGAIWLGLMNYGICKIDQLTWSSTFYSDNEKVSSAINSNNDVKSILASKTGNFYLATDSGLKIFNPSNKTFKRYRYNATNTKSISANKIMAMYEDTKGNLWVATNNGGFNKFDIQHETFERISCSYFNNKTEVYSILSDSRENLWLSSNIGIIKFETHSNSFVLFDKTDGTISNEFNAGAFYKNKRGEIYYGGLNGITIFNPDSISTFTGDFKLAFNSVQANNKTINFEFNPQAQPTVTLNPDDNTFSIDFAALNYIAPEKIQYAYKLVGFDKDWVYIGNRHFTIYNNLTPGNYQFKFKASAADGVWKESTNNLTIIVKPPFWRQWWFATIIALLIIVVVYFIVTIRTQKITEQKRKELDAQSNKMKQQFLANMSHEIRTPMNSVIGFTELLGQTDLNNEQKNYLNAIKNSAENLLVIINDILDFSKIDAGKVELQKENIPVQKVIDKVYSTLYLKAKEKGLLMVFEKLSDVPEIIHCDEVRLYQILTNLLNNAIKFTNHGKIGLQILKLDDHNNIVKLQFKIYDTGIGIEQEKVDKIFDSFTQANMNTSKKYGGTGLGLAIAKQLIDLHNGTITLESEVDKGTTFYVTIPFEKVHSIHADTEHYNQLTDSYLTSKNTKNAKVIELNQEKATTPISEEIVATVVNNLVTKPKILLAEDNAFNQLLAKTVLNKYFPDAELTIANNGKEVLAFINEGKLFDIILMDVQMPEMDGFETTIQIRQHQDFPINIIPIIACTAGVTPPEVQQCFDSGMDDFLAKPFQPNDLANKINYHLNKKKDNLAKHAK